MYIPHGKKLFLEIAGIFLAGVIVLIVFLILRLEEGPFKANFLRPFIESKLSAQSDLDVQIGDVTLEWQGPHAPFYIEINSITADDDRKTQIATVANIKLSLSATALVEGEVKPLALEITNPQFSLKRGTSQKQETPTEQTPASFDLRPLLSPDKKSTLSAWHHIAVTGGDLKFVDDNPENNTEIKDANLQVERDPDGPIHAVLKAETIIKDRATPLEGAAEYIPQQDTLSFHAHCDRIDLDTVASLSPSLAALQALQVPVSLQLDGEANSRLAVKSAHLVSQISPGQVADTDLFDAPAPITGGQLDIGYQSSPERLDLNDFTLNLHSGSLSTKGIATTADGIVTFDTTTSFTNVPIDDLQTYWPKAVSKGGRRWVTQNLSKGLISNGKMHLSGTAPRNDLSAVSFETVDGGFHVDNALVHYFGQLPSIEAVAGDVKFDDKVMTITLNSGHIADVTLNGGTVIINGLSANDQDIKIDVAISGSIATYLSIINRDPLNYARKLKIDPAGTSGSATVNLQMAFPLLADVSSDQMQIDVKANLQSVTLPHMVGNADIANLSGALDITAQTMNFKGSGSYKGVALKADWTQNFSPQQGIDSDATIEGRLSDKDRAALGFDFPERLTGPVQVTAHYVDKGDQQQADIGLDLTDADFKVNEVGYEKPSKLPGHAAFTLFLDRRGLNRIDNIDVKGQQLDVTGNAVFDPETESLRHLSFNRFKAGDTDLSGTVDKSPDTGTIIVVQGAVFDVGQLLHEKSASAKSEVDPNRRLKVDFNVGRLQTSPATGLDQVKGSIYLVGSHWQKADMTAQADGTPFTFSYIPQSDDADTGHVLTIETPDAGKVLNDLNFTNSVRGGILHIDGKQENPVDGARQPLIGTAEMKSFRLVNTPFLGRLLNLLSLTGLRETFSGQGIAFDIFSVDFEINDQTVVLQDGQVEGASIGMTVEGTENRGDNTIDLNGTVVPAYSANQMLNSVPLLGPLLTGGDGQGVFAATYHVTGTFDDPKVSVNPLSIFTPGVLRDLFFNRKAPDDLPGTPD